MSRCLLLLRSLFRVAACRVSLHWLGMGSALAGKGTLSVLQGASWRPSQKQPVALPSTPCWQEVLPFIEAHQGPAWILFVSLSARKQDIEELASEGDSAGEDEDRRARGMCCVLFPVN